MKPGLIFCVALVLSGGLVGCATDSSLREYLIDDDPLARPEILSYSKPSSETLHQIKIKRISLSREQFQKLNTFPMSKTENGVRWLLEEKPDTMREGPWHTRLYIFDATDTHHCLSIELVDHSSSEVHHVWLNDKMLFVRVWFGRIAWTDFVLNTETGRLAYIEDGRLDAVPEDERNNCSQTLKNPIA